MILNKIIMRERLSLAGVAAPPEEELTTLESLPAGSFLYFLYPLPSPLSLSRRQ